MILNISSKSKYSAFFGMLIKRSLSIRKSILFHRSCFYFSPQFRKWEIPDGYDTGIKVYNAEERANVPLVLKNEGIASWYLCGPTVYADAHIGHASCYIKFDIIRRIMEYVFGINVVLLMGVTDIDDKIIKKANEMNVSIQHISKQYESEFFTDMETLRIVPPTAVSRVTENIPLIISFCEKIIEKGFAYVTTEGNVYFSVSKVDPRENDEPNEDLCLIDPLKRDPRDFALWKRVKPCEPWWSSPWGKGRPGWHIECSAMASNVFGSELDIHSGGLDLAFPHHANEKSQSEAYHGQKKWVNYWLHAGLLHIHDDTKMSKSLGNTITIKEFLKGNNVNDFRILCLQSPYRNSIQYSQECLDGAKGIHKTLHNFLNEAETYVEGHQQCRPIDEADLLSSLNHTKDAVKCALSDDFNSSKALLKIVSFIGQINPCLQPSLISSPVKSVQVIASCASYVDNMLEIFGVKIVCKKKLPKKVVCGVDALVNFRTDIREYALKKGKRSSNHGDIAEKLNLEHQPFSNWLDSLKAGLSAAGIELKVQGEKLIWFEKQNTHSLFNGISKDITCALDALLEFYQNIHACIKKTQESHIQDVAAVATSKLKKGGLKSFESDLLKACDEFRSALNGANIAVKDKGEISYWCPTENFFVPLKEDCISNKQDIYCKTGR